MTGRTSSARHPPRAGRRAPQRSYAGRTAAERRAERRERLLEAGLQLFGTDGYAATSIEKLCAAAGVSTRSFYEEFDGREALLMALHDRVTQRALDAVIAALGTDERDRPVPCAGASRSDDGGTAAAGTAAAHTAVVGTGVAGTGAADRRAAGTGDSVRRRIEKGTAAYVTALTSDPRWTRIASVELIGVSRAVEEHRLRWRALWAELLETEAIRARGPLSADRADYHLAAVAVIGAVNELMLNWCTTGGSPPQGITAIIVRFIMGLLRAQ